MAQTHSFQLIVASVGEVWFEGEAQSLSVPSSDGVLTILPHHEPYVTTLKAGTLVVHDHIGTKQEIAVTSGLVEIANNRAVVLL